LKDEPRRVLAELSELRVMDVILPTRDGLEIRQRYVTQPTDHPKILLDRLGWRLPGTLQETPMERKSHPSSPSHQRTYVNNWGSWARSH
jgi:hypothetical protein